MTEIGAVIGYGHGIPDDVVRVDCSPSYDRPFTKSLCLVVELGNSNVEYWINESGDQWGDEDIPEWLYPLTVTAVRKPAEPPKTPVAFQISALSVGCANVACSNKPGEGAFAFIETREPVVGGFRPLRFYLCYPCATALRDVVNKGAS